MNNDDDAPDTPSDRRPRETPDERADRNFDELLQELRVAQTGVQILFAFLLTIPFQQRFSQAVGAGLRWEYLGTLLATAIASALLIAPVSYHRILFQPGAQAEHRRVLGQTGEGRLVLPRRPILGSLYLVVAVVSARDIASGWPPRWRCCSSSPGSSCRYACVARSGG